MMKLGIFPGIGAYNPHNHRFQGLGGTRQMDGYQGPIMSLVMSTRGMNQIDILLSNISERMFILSEIMPDKYQCIMDHCLTRFKFLAKYLQKYYGNKLEPNQKISLPSSASVFASVIEARNRPLELRKVLIDKKLRLTENDIYGQPTIIDKLLTLYTSTKSKSIDIYNVLLKQCPYDSESLDKERLYLVEDPVKRFWMYYRAYHFCSHENMSHLVHERIARKNLNYIFFKRIFKYCIQRENRFLPPLRLFVKENKDEILGLRERKFRLKWNVEQARLSIKDLVENQPYADLVNRAFSEAMQDL